MKNLSPGCGDGIEDRYAANVAYGVAVGWQFGALHQDCAHLTRVKDIYEEDIHKCTYKCTYN